MKKILMVTTNFPPSNSIGTQRLLRICKYLNKDWHIHILTLKEKYFGRAFEYKNHSACLLRKNIIIWRTEKADLLSYLIRLKKYFFENQVKKTKVENDIDKALEINWKRSSESSIGLYLKKIAGFITDILEFPDKEIAWLPFAVLKGLHIIRANNIKVIFSSSPRHSNHLTATILKFLTKKKLIIEFRDPWARSPWHDEVRASTALERFKHRILQTLEKWVVESADQIIFVTKAMKDDFATYYNYLEMEKFRIFYNGFDPINIKKRSSFLHKGIYKESNKKLIFSHIGALYKRRNPLMLINAIKTMIEQYSLKRTNILFQFIGIIADDLKSIKDYINELKLEDVVKFIPPVSYNESYKFMDNSDVLILLQPFTRLQLPAKFYDYICFDKPILALGEKNSEVEKIVDNQFGIFADYNDINEVIKSILYLIDNPEYCSENIKNLREPYDISKSIKLFEVILEQ